MEMEKTQQILKCIKPLTEDVVLTVFFSAVVTVQSRIRFTGDIEQRFLPDTFSAFHPGQIFLFLAVMTLTLFACALIRFLYETPMLYPFFFLPERPVFTYRRKLLQWIGYTAAVEAVWFFFLLMDYPGSIVGDSISSLLQATGRQEFSNHHPVAFTLFAAAFMRLGRLLTGDFGNIGVFLFSLAQQVMVAMTVGYFMTFLRARGGRRRTILLLWLFFACNPFFAIHSFIMQKDTLFSAMMFLLVLQLYRAAESEYALFLQRRYIIQLVLLLCAVSFLRNNGLYIVIALVAYYTLRYGRFYRALATACLAGLCVILLVRYPGFRLMGVNTDQAQESLSIPLQQVAYTISEKGMEGMEGSDYLGQLLPKEAWLSEYHPFCADFLKGGDAFNRAEVNRSVIPFLSVWLRNLPENFICYVKAWLMDTYGFWSVGTWDDAGYCVLSVEENDFGIHAVDLLRRAGLPDLSFLNHLTGRWSAGALFWLSVMIVCIMMRGKRKTAIETFLPLFLLWGTLMIATPIAFNFRYALAYAYAFPLILLMPLLCKQKEIG